MNSYVTIKVPTPPRGFTLVETLVAVTVLITVILVPMTTASRGIQNAAYAKEQTVALYLAQEALEYVSRLRDNAALANFQDYQTNGNNGNGDTWGWYNALTLCRNAAGCDINFETSPVTYRDCTTTNTCVLNQYTGTGAVNRVHSYLTGVDWIPSIYTRVVRIGAPVGASAPAAGGVPVTVTVSWQTSLFGGTRSVVLQTYLYDVYSRFE